MILVGRTCSLLVGQHVLQGLYHSYRYSARKSGNLDIIDITRIDNGDEEQCGLFQANSPSLALTAPSFLFPLTFDVDALARKPLSPFPAEPC